jgi:hypothetical protein
MSMKNSNDTIVNRTRNLPTFSALRHRVPRITYNDNKNTNTTTTTTNNNNKLFEFPKHLLGCDWLHQGFGNA